MSYSCTDFTDTILDALAIEVPEESWDSPSDQADLALAAIARLERRARMAPASPFPDAPPVDLARSAVAHLRAARDLLKRAGAATRTVDRVRLALASAEGAVRHAENRRAP